MTDGREKVQKEEFDGVPEYLMILITQECNLNCSYCYLHEKPEGQIRREVVEPVFRWLASSGKKVHFQITGGEPLLYPELVEYILKRIRSDFSSATVGIQTNGSLIDDALSRMFKKYGVQVGISLDGTEEVHDEFRSGFSETLRGIVALEREEVDFGITCVVYEENVRNLDELLLTLAGFRGFRGINLDLLTVKKPFCTGPKPALPASIKEGVGKLLRALYWVNRYRAVPIRFSQMEALFRKGSPCPAVRKKSLAVCPDGELYPCAHLIGDETFSCGFVDDLSGRRDAPYELLKKSVSKFRRKNRSFCHLCPCDCPARLYYNYINTFKDLATDPACTLFETVYAGVSCERFEELSGELAFLREVK